MDRQNSQHQPSSRKDNEYVRHLNLTESSVVEEDPQLQAKSHENEQHERVLDDSLMQNKQVLDEEFARLTPETTNESLKWKKE
ncbi:hypothetical protein SJAG_01815 [Schizosaccharomyces japonicus yFS275]|uniref:Uncharacterized protein n=1 Tax=Schizosaccharomyces japonicus (strain yFS275 / FY16936) TaxID=402676 RepID=B6JYZ2_SCHJY|nr:hypothetical protein SJAG_01815 [Schizosaccharomyces japonicus yFS275]EEB06760.1 hypothetical protein SJAG_01815 [Schizosaccharomyces japonicus yFS275]